MKSNPKQKAVYLALCILAAIVVWIFVDNFGNNGGAVMHTKWFRDVPITYDWGDGPYRAGLHAAGRGYRQHRGFGDGRDRV